ncbi:50S ribosomal protein L32 [Candidatus Kaiserbacteria bacterium RIFCSPHIGHO2_02_FULL_55_20]|uniref:Large ribosomal subunit protein bL32 n=1 Tax=Candidatus Kaiserbacteria bacterium RIFCSPHIGHO2_02_FULL_55_20 TaxID=1798497 RepID=A0A1F6DVN2_9BACT|nr:MAG: 50S ribosomal protein L32 [Candidatus Kaiserbacteria bacterium RIFCSPHIGHO2_01_FULL_55_37]OGG65443.1 MAG: 50S ribosomal protein L32 [Candidatus Kaiserbacteria bacterium RIFCSPHIGHO2_02_FULL_55_20]
MRVNRSKSGKRRSHHAIAGQRLAKCECGASRISHRACPQCGKYNGKVIIDIVAAAKRAARRQKRKQTELRAAGQTDETKEKETAPTSA